MSTSPSQLKRYEQPAGNWIDGREFGVSDRQLRNLFDHLKSLGAARKPRRGVYLFDCNHPEIVPRLRKARRDRSYADMSDLTAKQVADAEHKKRIVETGQREIAKRMADKGCGRTEAVAWFCTHRAAEIPKLESPDGVKVRSFNRWEAKCKKSTHKLRALIDTRGRAGTGVGAFDEDSKPYLLTLYLDDRRRSLQLCYELTQVEADKQGWHLGTYVTVRRWIKRNIPEPTIILARKGKKAFESQCTPRIRRDRSDVFAGDVWCGDECTLDFYAQVPDGQGGVKRGRLILTAWLDERSRMFVGWHIGDRANSDTILAAFKSGVRKFGLPRNVHIDNGKDYKAAAGRKKRQSKKWTALDAKRVGGVFSDLEIDVNWSIPYRPMSKIIESHFNPVHNRFDRLFESYCGRKPEERPEGAMGIRVSELPTIGEVREAFAAWLIAHHDNAQTGSGMNNRSPQKVFDEERNPVRRETLDGDRLDFLCSKYTAPRKVTKDGVRYNGVFYGQDCEAVWMMQGKTVVLRVDPEEADFVWVCDAVTRLPITKAHNRRITGVTQDHIRDAERRKVHHKRAVKKYMEARFVDLDDSVGALIEAQRLRNESAQGPKPDPAPAESIQLVRADIGEDLAAPLPPADLEANDDAACFAFPDVPASEDGFDDMEDDTEDGIDWSAGLDPTPLEDQAEDEVDGFAVLAERAKYGTAG